MALTSKRPEVERPHLLENVEEVLRRSIRERPLALLLVVAPAVFTIIVVVASRVLPLAAAIPIAIIATIPGTAIAWSSGVWASTSLDQGSKALAEMIRSQLKKRRHIALFEGRSGLYVDWYMTLRLHEEVQRAKRYEQPLSLVLLAPSGHADENPSHDRAELGDALRHRLRASDLAGVISNDEVAILLPNSGATEAREVRRRLRPLIAPFGYLAGIATLGRDGEGHEELVKAALEDAHKVPKRRQRQRLAA